MDMAGRCEDDGGRENYGGVAAAASAMASGEQGREQREE